MGPILALGFLALAVLLHYLRSRVSLTRRRHRYLLAQRTATSRQPLGLTSRLLLAYLC